MHCPEVSALFVGISQTQEASGLIVGLLERDIRLLFNKFQKTDSVREKDASVVGSRSYTMKLLIDIDSEKHSEWLMLLLE